MRIKLGEKSNQIVQISSIYFSFSLSLSIFACELVECALSYTNCRSTCIDDCIMIVLYIYIDLQIYYYYCCCWIEEI